MLSEYRQRMREIATDAGHYVTSLWEEGLRCGRLTAETVSRLRGEVLCLLEQQAVRWTRGERCSLRTETAEELLQSVLYTMGVALKAEPSPEEALVRLERCGAAAVFAEGQQRIRRKLRAARLLHRALVRDLLVTPSVFYRATLRDGICGFFRVYRPELTAHLTHITADYPLFFPVRDLTGIEFIETYLERAVQENRFCRCFAADAVHRLLQGLYGAYEGLLLNLYEPVLHAALACAVTEAPIRGLQCRPEALQKRLEGTTPAARRRMLDAALETLARELALTPAMYRYAAAALPELARGWERAHSLGAWGAVAAGDAVQPPELRLRSGERMSDREYTALLEAWHREPEADRRLELLGRVSAYGDLIEWLHDTAPSREELQQMLPRLPADAWVVLMTQYPEESLLTDPQDRRLCAALQQLCDGLPRAEAEVLRRAAAHVHWE